MSLRNEVTNLSVVKNTDFCGDTPLNLFFNNATVSAISLVDYLNWACGTCSYEHVLALPPIQRGSVWKPKQIIDLWDSLLRKMPVGSFMLSRLGKDDARTSIPVISKLPMEAKGKLGFNLLDGQQRTLAMLLAWPGIDNVDKRIWIDLGENGANGSPFALRITTQSQPFGFQSVSHTKLSLSDCRKARQRAINLTIKDGKQIPNYQLPLNETFPWKADEKEQKLLVPIRDLWDLLQKNNSNIKEWIKYVLCDYFDSELTLTLSQKKRLLNFGKSLIYLEQSSVALILVPDLKRPKKLNDPSHDPMTVLFERIATGGTRLTPDELLFSMIKQVYPEAHNLVQEIHSLKDENDCLPLVGHLMKQTELVMTSVRLACADPNAPNRIKELNDNPNPNAKDFYKYLENGDMLGTDINPGPLLNLIKKTNDNVAPLVRAFQKLGNILKHGGGDDDMGLPRVLLPYISQSLLQILLFWLVHQKDENAIKESRENIIRFVLYWILCERDIKSSRKASQIAFYYLKNYLKENKLSVVFPDKELYIELSKEDNKGDIHLLMLVDPLTLKKSLRLRPSPILRKMSERFKKNAEPKLIESYSYFWRRKSVLLWIQRAMLTREYGYYDALADKNDKDNAPYDFDHLCPQSHWSDGRVIYVKPDLAQEDFCSSWNRSTLGNSIGNYRVIDASENRSDSDMSLSDKFDLNIEINQPNKKWIDSVFFLSDIEIARWRRASPTCSTPRDHRSWDAKRIKRFQSAVEYRAFWLYERYFNEAKFINWFT